MTPAAGASPRPTGKALSSTVLASPALPYKRIDIEKTNGASARVQGKSPSSVTNTPFAVNTVADLFARVKHLDGNIWESLLGRLPPAIAPLLIGGSPSGGAGD